MNKFVSYIKLLRPQQWTKNFFVFLPLFFDRRLLDFGSWIPCIIAFVAFCLASSGIYCLNDVLDADTDRLHPKKRHRPIANGSVTKRGGVFVAIACELCVTMYFVFDACVWHRLSEVWIIILLYVLLNLAYAFRLKHIAIVDVFIVALGFVFRVLSGGIAAHIFISHWIVLMTFLLALFLAIAKRRDDVVIFEQTGKQMRHSIMRYNLAFMNQSLSIVAAITMVCYILYTVSDEVIARVGNSYLYVTSIFVLAGIIKYLQLTIVDTKSSSPTKILLHNRFIQCCILGWLVTFFIILYVL